jgi:hypothetical protein
MSLRASDVKSTLCSQHAGQVLIPLNASPCPGPLQNHLVPGEGGGDGAEDRPGLSGLSRPQWSHSKDCPL